MSVAAYAAIGVGVFFALLCWGARLNEKDRRESKSNQRTD